MHITRQNKQLVKIAGSVNLLFFLLSIAFVLFLGLGYDHSKHQMVIRKAITFTLANSVCWIVNLVILMVIVPLLSKWKNARWLSFYLPSYLITFSLAILIANSNFYQVLSDEPPGEPLRSPVWGPILFAIGINTLSLVAIKLILARWAQTNIRVENANIKMENAELKMKSLEAQHDKLKNQL